MTSIKAIISIVILTNFYSKIFVKKLRMINIESWISFFYFSISRKFVRKFIEMFSIINKYQK